MRLFARRGDLLVYLAYVERTSGGARWVVTIFAPREAWIVKREAPPALLPFSWLLKSNGRPSSRLTAQPVLVEHGNDSSHAKSVRIRLPGCPVLVVPLQLAARTLLPHPTRRPADSKVETSSSPELVQWCASA